VAKIDETTEERSAHAAERTPQVRWPRPSFTPCIYSTGTPAGHQSWNFTGTELDSPWQSRYNGTRDRYSCHRNRSPRKIFPAGTLRMAGLASTGCAAHGARSRWGIVFGRVRRSRRIDWPERRRQVHPSPNSRHPHYSHAWTRNPGRIRCGTRWGRRSKAIRISHRR